MVKQQTVLLLTTIKYYYNITTFKLKNFPFLARIWPQLLLCVVRVNRRMILHSPLLYKIKSHIYEILMVKRNYTIDIPTLILNRAALTHAHFYNTGGDLKVNDDYTTHGSMQVVPNVCTKCLSRHICTNFWFAKRISQWNFHGEHTFITRCSLDKHNTSRKIPILAHLRSA